MAKQSEVEARITRIREKAASVFDTQEIVDDWMCTENLVLGDAPINLLETEEGADRVEAILGRIEHGVYS
ncbi:MULTISPECIES: MbcA/ParS/Xre antitoxin family protein [unclassified Thioalkalivibrio]|uniref:MbcA/ParS/Xre antitoxin family protein n=1 Tax=unclassified Thioalkalivibrio TaxID=2621013 RepID=UPI00036A75AA|nr:MULTISPECIES: MbcA/ParS/Xre antitoxin family protein [unclassified Thioalkalivibrio]